MYDKRHCKHKESVNENNDGTDYPNNEFVQMKQYDQKDIDNEGYIIPQSNCSEDCGQLYDIVN